MNRDYCVTLANGPTCEKPQGGRVGNAIDSLSNSSYRLDKLVDELTDLILHPRPQAPADQQVCGAPKDFELTLVHQISRITARTDDTIDRLEMAVNVIRENLSGIKLD